MGIGEIQMLFRCRAGVNKDNAPLAMPLALRSLDTIRCSANLWRSNIHSNNFGIASLLVMSASGDVLRRVRLGVRKGHVRFRVVFEVRP